MASIAGIGLDMDIIAERPARPVDELDDAETIVDGFEQGAVSRLGLCQRIDRRKPGVCLDCPVTGLEVYLTRSPCVAPWIGKELLA